MLGNWIMPDADATRCRIHAEPCAEINRNPYGSLVLKSEETPWSSNGVPILSRRIDLDVYAESFQMKRCGEVPQGVRRGFLMAVLSSATFADRVCPSITN